MGGQGFQSKKELGFGGNKLTGTAILAALCF